MIVDIAEILWSMERELPKYDGSSDPHLWISIVNDFFDSFGSPESLRLRMAPLHLERRAVSWFEWMDIDNLVSTWPEFISGLLDRFESAESFAARRQGMSKLTTVTSIAEFVPKASPTPPILSPYFTPTTTHNKVSVASSCRHRDHTTTTPTVAIPFEVLSCTNSSKFQILKIPPPVCGKKIEETFENIPRSWSLPRLQESEWKHGSQHLILGDANSNIDAGKRLTKSVAKNRIICLALKMFDKMTERTPASTEDVGLCVTFEKPIHDLMEEKRSKIKVVFTGLLAYLFNKNNSRIAWCFDPGGDMVQRGASPEGHLVYVADRDVKSVIAFEKGFNTRKTSIESTGQFSCHYGLDTLKLWTRTTMVAHDVRRPLPKSVSLILDKSQGVRDLAYSTNQVSTWMEVWVEKRHAKHIWPWITMKEARFPRCSLRTRDERSGVSFMGVNGLALGSFIPSSSMLAIQVGWKLFCKDNQFYIVMDLSGFSLFSTLNMTKGSSLSIYSLGVVGLGFEKGARLAGASKVIDVVLNFLVCEWKFAIFVIHLKVTMMFLLTFFNLLSEVVTNLHIPTMKFRRNGDVLVDIICFLDNTTLLMIGFAKMVSVEYYDFLQGSWGMHMRGRPFTMKLCMSLVLDRSSSSLPFMLTQQMWSPKNMMCATDLCHGCHLNSPIMDNEMKWPAAPSTLVMENGKRLFHTHPELHLEDKVSLKAWGMIHSAQLSQPNSVAQLIQDSPSKLE